MKTVRFGNVVQACGRPEPYLVLIEPKQDRALQAAIKAQRVMTVFQTTVGTKADHAEIGFQPGGGRQFWVFPKSLRQFEGRPVVGIKYELLRAVKTVKAKPEKAVKRTPSAKKTKLPEDKPEPRKVIAFKPAKEPCAKAEAAADEANEELEEVKALVRKAMDLLEEGRQVAAFNLLKRAVGE